MRFVSTSSNLRRLSFIDKGIVVFIGALLPTICLAQAPEFEDWNAKFQATYVWQAKRPFSAAYSGQNSLTTDREKSYSFTATAALGFRPWAGGELYFDPEAAQGVPLSSLTGLGGFTNGEIARTAGSTLKLYRARFFYARLGDWAARKRPLNRMPTNSPAW